MAEPTYTQLTFDELRGWQDDDHRAAFDVFTNTCRDLDDRQWAVLCEFAKTNPEPRGFFEKFFRPVLIEDGEPMLFTGYFEPQLPGSRERGDAYQYPIYGVPDDLVRGEPYFTRREIDEDRPLVGRGLELAWLTDPVDLFFLQVQGSGRISLPDGSMMRVGYGGKNGRNYSSVGMALVDRGVFEPHQVSAAVIRNWVRKNRKQGRELLWENESYVFFREVSEVPADRGPLGAMNRSITQGRTVAVDPEYVTLGAPVWIEKDGATPMNRLMVAQDTGSAIKGAQRADIFFGTGAEAGLEAGKIKDGGRMVVLMPATMAHRVVIANR
ncbi:MltA domain-containing protein [Yoonia sp. F2084L]|uniref:murein transglycosylase A n=1 Tax=Yoonia sp. F2084L TaxID=2926419 RepID=UPI001FF421F5|nr:MltA domain-containing protein [Yoonia sp. F2084L]MCK0097218.1 MltA domain-containing protein [Yoonia sp. F2084L]